MPVWLINLILGIGWRIVDYALRCKSGKCPDAMEDDVRKDHTHKEQ